MQASSSRALTVCLALIAAALLPATLLAEPQAVIEGPEKVSPGDLTILDAGKSTGTHFAWSVIPTDAKHHCFVFDEGRKCVFAMRREGTYVFVLAVSDAEGIKQITHTLINAEGDTPQPPPGPGPGPGPGPTPDPKPDDPQPEPQPGDDWANWAKSTAESTVDMPAGGPRQNAARALAAALDKAAETVKSNSNYSLKDARVLLARLSSEAIPLEEQPKWYKFSTAMDAQLRKAEESGRLKDTASWAAIIVSIARGLKEVR